MAAHKTEALLRAGAQVTVISPTLTPALASLVDRRQLTHHARTYRDDDVGGFFLAVAATDDATLHAQIARDARTAGVLLNVVDRPELCDFILPSIMERGDLVIATSTGGASPALAKRIRHDLQEAFGPEYDLALQLLARLRTRLASGARTAAERRRIFAALVDSPLLEYLRAQRTEEVDCLLAATVGDGVSLASLGLELHP